MKKIEKDTETILPFDRLDYEIRFDIAEMVQLNRNVFI